MDDDLALVRAVLSLTVSRWQGIVETVPREALERPAVDGEWSAVDCLRHMAGSEHLWARHLHNFGDGDAKALFEHTELELTLSPGELVATLAERRAESLALLAGLASDGTALTTSQPGRAGFTLSQVLNGWAAHDLQHTVQAEEAVMQPLIRRCGYLRPVFADHDLETKASGSS